jgi:hypothetical protein
MLVFPAPGLRVRDPATRAFVPDDGLEVSETDLIWARLIRDGDVVTGKPAAQSRQVAPVAPAIQKEASE